MNLSIRSKIIATTLAAVFFSILISLVNVWFEEKNIKTLSTIVEVLSPNRIALKEMQIAAIQIESAVNLLINTNTKKEQANLALEKYLFAIDEFNSQAKFYESLPFFDGEEAAWLDLKNNFWKNYSAKAKVLIDLSSTENTKDQAERDLLGKTEWDVLVKMREYEFSKVINLQNKESELRSAEVQKQKTMLRWLTPTLFALIALLSGSISFIIGTKISKTLLNVTEAINQTTYQVSSTSNKVATSSQDFSQATIEQAASLEETAASLEEITAMIDKSAENAKVTMENSSLSQHKAEEGRKFMNEMLSQMEDIKNSNEDIMNQVHNSNQQMQEVVQVIKEIETKTKVINEIVFQTKLLSFNASVEAARAGEHGKGFAVVAEEVGNLAQLSGNAAKEISEMLDSNISRVEKIVQDTQAKVNHLADIGRQKVDQGVDVAKQCSMALDEIVTNVNKVSTLAHEIAQASSEQSMGVGEINKAMGQLDAVTQQNSSTSLEVANAASLLSNQSKTLESAVKDLVITINGGITLNQKTQWQSSMELKLGSVSKVVFENKPTKKVQTSTAPQSHLNTEKSSSNNHLNQISESHGTNRHLKSINSSSSHLQANVKNENQNSHSKSFAKSELANKNVVKFEHKPTVTYNSSNQKLVVNGEFPSHDDAGFEDV